MQHIDFSTFHYFNLFLRLGQGSYFIKTFELSLFVAIFFFDQLKKVVIQNLMQHEYLKILLFRFLFNFRFKKKYVKKIKNGLWAQIFDRGLLNC